MSSNEQFEREFESFLKDEDSRIAALYRKLPQPEPDAKLDAAVLAMARRAAASAPRTRPRTSRWIPALSAAAVVALAAGIAIRIGPTVWPERNTSTMQKSAGQDAAPAPPAQTASTENTSAADSFKDAAPKPIAAPPAAEPAAPPAAAVPSGGYAPPKQEARAQLRKPQPTARRIDAPAPQAFPAQTPVAQEKKAAELDESAADSNAVHGQAGSADAQPVERQRDAQLQTAPEPPAEKTREEGAAELKSIAPPPPTAPPAREQPMPLPTEPVSAAATRVETESTSAALAAPAAKAATYRSKDPNARLYPEHWLANIRSMLREDKRDEALRSLAEFRKMYPEYHLPDDLRDLK